MAARIAKRTATPRYGVHPGVQMMQEWVAGLKAKTGRSLEQWLKFIKQDGPADEAACRDWLKANHQLGTNSAWWLAERAVGKGGEDDNPEAYLAAAEKWVEEQYAGAKAGLRPLYEHLLRLACSIADDVKACPCKTIVPLYRAHVIAQVKPATRDRIDFGLALKDIKTPKRLIDTGGFAKKDRITRKIEIRTFDDIDDEVERWLRKAYDMDT